MAGVKISKLLAFDDVYHDSHFPDFVNEMIIPVSLGERTMRVKVKELLTILNNNDDTQNERLDAHDRDILNNTELINRIAEQIYAKIEENKTEQEAKDSSQDTHIGEIEAEVINPWEIYGE